MRRPADAASRPARRRLRLRRRGHRFPWRYWLTDERTVSAYRPAYRAADVGRRPVRGDDAGRDALAARLPVPHGVLPGDLVNHILDELEWRGLIALTTDLDALRDALCRRARVALLRLRPDRAEPAHRQPRPDPHRAPPAGRRPPRRSRSSAARPGLIGDPKMAGERTLNARDVVAGWVERIREQIEPLLALRRRATPRRMVNNLDWTAPLSAIDFLRDIGKHYRLGTMLAKDTVARRLNSDAGHQLHRVQLPDPAGHGLPRAVPPARLHAADRRQRPVGQPALAAST